MNKNRKIDMTRIRINRTLTKTGHDMKKNNRRDEQEQKIQDQSGHEQK